MKILVCDDEEYALSQLAACVTEYMQKHYIQHCRITALTDPVKILETDESYDLAFLDIQMAINGISLAKILKDRNSKTVIFFITNYSEYQDDAMDLRAFRYFEKPFDIKRLYSGLDKAMEYIDGTYIDIFIHSHGEQTRLLVDDIVYITRENRKTVLKTGSESCYQQQTFDELVGMLPPLFFYQVHKSYYVNLHYVATYSYTELTLLDGTRIPVAPRKQADFHKFWFEYLRRR